MLLLNYSKNLQAATNDGVPSTGGVERSDSAVIAVPTILIKKANAKMIERKYLLLITNEQDSIINMKDKYINEQQKIITDFQQRVKEVNKINQQINTDLVKQRSKFKTICWGGSGIIVALLIGLLVK